MLTRLLPDQISKLWDVIKPAIEKSLPPIASGKSDRMSRVLMSLLSSKSQCWASYIIKDGTRRFEGIVVTKISEDYISGEKSLLIYSVCALGKVSRESWTGGFKSLVKYAMSHDCDKIIAFTNVPFLVHIAKKLGGDTSYTFVSLPVWSAK